ncbi:phospholipase-like protein, partial [Tanacetum coccineum]
MRQSWFMANVDFIKGLADQDGKFFQDDEARVNCIEHNNGMCGDTEVGKFVQDEEARVNGIEHHNGMCGDTEVGKFVQDEEARVNGIEHHNGMCGDTEDGNFVEGIDETICPKSNQIHIDGMSTEGKPSSSSSNTRNEKDASHLDDLMEIDGENLSYTNSQDHLNLLIKALESKTENPTLDVVVPLKDDDCILRTRKPNDAYDVVEVDNYEDDYMLMLNDEEKHVKSSLNDMELEQEPDKIDVKQGILEQQPNAPKGKTTVFEETVWVKVEEKPGLGRGVGPLKVKKKNCQRAFRPNYLLRSTKDRKKKLAMALKPPFGQQSATTPVLKKKKIQDYENRNYFSNGHMYPLPWQVVEKVYFPVNEPKTHWCLAELEIRTEVVTFYDSVSWAGGSRRRWWRRMKKSLLQKLTVNLVMHDIFESKGISA